MASPLGSVVLVHVGIVTSGHCPCRHDFICASASSLEGSARHVLPLSLESLVLRVIRGHCPSLRSIHYIFLHLVFHRVWALPPGIGRLP